MLTYRNELRQTLTVSIPMIFGQVGQILMGVADSVMVGRLGAAPLAASAFVNNVVNIPLVFLIGISTCISVKVSQSYGQNEPAAVSSNFLNGSALSLLWTGLIVAGLLVFQPFLTIFRQPPEVLELSFDYYLIIVLSLLPVLVFQCAKSFCDGLSDTIPASLLMLFGLLLNVFLNWLLIYGNLGFTALGLTGAAYGTLISRSAMAALMVAYIFRKPVYASFVSFFRHVQISRTAMAELSRIGIPSGLQFLFEVGAFAGSGIMMGWISTEALAAHQIALNLASLTFMVALGLALGASVRIGQAFGQKNRRQVQIIGRSTLFFVAGLEFVFAVLFLGLRDYLPTLYVHETIVIKLASQMLLIAALFQLFDGIQCVALGLLRGLSDVRIPTAITFFAYWVIGLPLCWALAFQLQLEHWGIWIGLLTALVFSSGLLSLRFLKLTDSRKITL